MKSLTLLVSLFHLTIAGCDSGITVDEYIRECSQRAQAAGPAAPATVPQRNGDSQQTVAVGKKTARKGAATDPNAAEQGTPREPHRTGVKANEDGDSLKSHVPEPLRIGTLEVVVKEYDPGFIEKLAQHDPTITGDRIATYARERWEKALREAGVLDPASLVSLRIETRVAFDRWWVDPLGVQRPRVFLGKRPDDAVSYGIKAVYKATLHGFDAGRNTTMSGTARQVSVAPQWELVRRSIDAEVGTAISGMLKINAQPKDPSAPRVRAGGGDWRQYKRHFRAEPQKVVPVLLDLIPLEQRPLTQTLDHQGRRVAARITALSPRKEWLVTTSDGRSWEEYSVGVLRTQLCTQNLWKELPSLGPLYLSGMARAFEACEDERRAAVALAMVEIDPDWAKRDCAKVFVPRYLEALSSENAQTRESAATALGMVCDEKAVLPLADLLNDSSYRVQQAAARSLGRIGNEQARELLIETMASLPEDDLIVRSAVAEALANIGDARAYEHLIASLDHGNPMMRMAAAEALGTLGDDRAVPRLIAAALRDENVHVTAAATDSLQKLTGKDFVNCKKWGRWLRKRKRQ